MVASKASFVPSPGPISAFADGDRGLSMGYRKHHQTVKPNRIRKSAAAPRRASLRLTTMCASCSTSQVLIFVDFPVMPTNVIGPGSSRLNGRQFFLATAASCGNLLAWCSSGEMLPRHLHGSLTLSYWSPGNAFLGERKRQSVSP
ncbi:uncharacterized protein LOC111251951 [Varroa destructor]|uniref:Uncharacterized protein n=1 Tax=Varroa destructor TaxID=109461 RepID=A0A7M7KK50_VARDE|nr:uncharacterized protein LOC111251951 [Varroa destructor]